ncbi:MAG TPA: ATP-binding protein [Candidatus Sulfopaludibacter sp.]|nr:ATP-binding protein [Candidatus Sulfopaludibacter sp.]
MKNQNLNIVLSPAQQKAYEGLLNGSAAGDVLLLKARPGSGRTTILRKLHEAVGGAFLGIRDFMQTLSTHRPEAIEEAFLQMLEQALAHHQTVIVDDLHLVTQVVQACDYPRALLLDAALTAILGEAAGMRKKLIFATDDEAPWPLARRAYCWKVAEFEAEDYACLCRNFLPEAEAGLDFDQIHRFAPALSAGQLRNTCNWLSHAKTVETASTIEYLRSHYMTSNVELDEVQRVTWTDLKGVDSVIRELEAKVALPFENDALRAELGLKPKRGVLLAGPPGTGKTTIGRALAHRLKSKFFLIDGTMVAGKWDFQEKIEKVFAAAKRNAPSIVFIDDADVIFEGKNDSGLYRYLLTMLDGLESASAERVCVMMTAMHPGSLPQALLRSGRVELWLETALPDAAARRAILLEKLAGLPAPIGNADVSSIAAAGDGLTGADLKNVVDDAKLEFAQDRLQGKTLPFAETYFLRAIETVRSNRRKYNSNRPLKLGASVKMGF